MKRFKKIYIEITNICNLDCDFCPKNARKEAWMEVDRFSEILEKIKPYTDHVYFHLMGEPLLHPKLKVFLDLCGERGFFVNLTTNGVLIKQMGDLLLDSPALRQVNFSLSSFEANRSFFQPDFERALDRYITEITDFMKRALKAGSPICSLRLWNLDTEELRGANNGNQQIIQLIAKNLELDSSIFNMLEEKRQCKLGKNLYLNLAEKFEWPDLGKTEVEKTVFCHGLRDQIGILVDGTVVPCCLDSEGSIPLGNIHRENMEEILASDRAKAIFDGFSNRQAVEELCQKCQYARRY